MTLVSFAGRADGSAGATAADAAGEIAVGPFDEFDATRSIFIPSHCFELRPEPQCNVSPVIKIAFERGEALLP